MDIRSSDKRRLSSRRAAIPWTAGLVGLGVGLRLFHYLRDPSVWHDEAALILNVLGKSFVELLGPLYFSEAAPPLFLWLEKGVSLGLGESPFALRLLPLVASCASLVLVALVARRLLAPAAVPWAVLLFGCSDRLLWHACEAKQYAIEALAAVAVVALFVGTREWPLGRRLALLIALAPLVLFTAYPGCFVYGALLLALLPAAWQTRRPAAWAGYAGLVLVVFGCFALLVLGPARAQRDATISACWEQMRQFPDWQRPWTVPLWTASSVLDLLDYCFKPLGQCLLPLAIAGSVLVWRRSREVLVLLAAPPALALAAAYLHAYPFGGTRVMVFAAPALALLIAAGIPPVQQWLRTRCRPAAWALMILALVPLGRAGHRLVDHWDRADCSAAAQLVCQARLPADAVTANHWEYRYYFRHLGPEFTPVEELSTPDADRLWVVSTGATAEERQHFIERFPSSQWRRLDERQFERTTVLLLERAGRAAMATAPRKPRLK